MSRRRTESTAGRHAGERLLSTLGSGLQEPAEPRDIQPEAVFVYSDPSQPPAPARSPPLTSALRFRTGLRAALLIGVLCLVGTGCFWWQALQGRTDVVPLNAGQAHEDAEGPGEPEEPGSVQTLPAVPGAQADPRETADAQSVAVVHVAGAVNSPGIVTLRAGSRINDAIAAAGGPSAVSDPGVLNLAAVVTDGQKIYVPHPGEELPAELAGAPPATGGSAPPTGGGAGTAKVNLNTATAAELDTLPKVGPVLAQKIIDWRLEHGPFATVEELDAVDGVGPKMLEALLPLVTL